MNIAVVSHDAGASEILCAYVKANYDYARWTLLAKKGSPFEKIAMREGLKTQIKFDAQQFDAVFFGTGWKEHFERPYILEAKKRHIPSFVFLDHWSSYRERFSYPNQNWKEHLPNFTVVSDKKAQELAQNYDFPNILRVNNYYLQKQLDSINSQEIVRTDSLLFLSEPTDQVALNAYGDTNYWGFTQNSALEDILKNFKRFECTGIHIRLHPSEKEHGYNKILKKFPHIKSQIYPSDFYPLEKDLQRSKLIIGFDTMALYTGALLSKPIVSYLPSHNREFFLPLPHSHQLRNLNDLTREHLHPIELSLSSDGINFALLKEKIKEFKPC